MAELIDTEPVARFAAEKALGAGATITKAQKLAGGAIHDSWGVDADTGSGPQQVVVRVTPAGRVDFAKTRREFEVLKVAHARGVRCPKPMIVGEAESGEDYLVMSRVGGDANPRQLVAGEAFATARKNIIGHLATDLAIIHQVQPEEVAAAPDMAGPPPGEDALAYQARATRDRYNLDLLNPHPAMEWAFRWLDRVIERMGPTGRPAHLVHGDFRIGNIMYDENGLSSILDWEGTHFGEAEEDLSWFLTRVWRFGQNDKHAGGIVTREEWAQAYEQASGRKVDRERLAAWEVLQNIRWVQITMMQARAHLDGQTVSHELAAIGRRTAETELEVLRLTGVEARVRHAG